LNDEEQTDLLRAILHTTARGTVPEDKLRKAVLGVKGGPRQVAAYNLCDGTRLQSEIAEEAGLDQGSLSRSVSRWVELGVLFRIGSGSGARLLHLYPLPPAD
jgi:DNA-binding MarR family transcriptional regulator